MGKLLKGDCFERLAELGDATVDLILTDPPYGMSYQSSWRESPYKKIENDKNLEWLPLFVDECYRVAKNNTAQYFFCSWHNIDVFKQELSKRFQVKNILVWEKNNTSMGDLKGDFAPKIEFVIFCHKGRSLIRGKRDPNIFKFNKTKNELHPTEKPVDLCQYMIEKFSDKGNLVLDPFMGSGTTGVAAVSTGRDFIGIELDEDYFKTASQRIIASKQANK